MALSPTLPPLTISYPSHYRLLGQIGQGQFGRVYCAIHRQTGRLYALKDLEHQVFPTNKFLRELTYLVTLRHPHIVTCHAVEYYAGGRYLVMDYCEGGTLRDLIEGEGTLILPKKIQLIQEILSALAQAHQANIIHCDIKPDNILLISSAQGWNVKVSDFGIARLAEITGNPNYGKGYTGSPAYMAPERFYGKFSPASDLYAVGVMLYELVCGDRPFSGLPGELQSAHFNRRLAFPDDFPPTLKTIVSRALEKLPQKRFQSAEAMASALQQATPPPPYSKAFFFLEPTRQRHHPVQVLQKDGLAFAVNHLEVMNQWLYLGMDKQVACRCYENPNLVGKYQTHWDSYLSAPLLALQAYPQRLAMFTKEPSRHQSSGLFRYSLYLLDTAQTTRTIIPRATASWITSQFCYALDPLGKWLAIVTQERELERYGQFRVLNVPQFKTIGQSHSLLFPAQLIALEHRHGLSISLAKTSHRQATIFRLFNRHGHLIRAFALPLLLGKLTMNTYSHNHVLGLDLYHKNQGFLIRLQPLKVTRLALGIDPHFIVVYPWGYLLAETQGRIVLLDDEGFHVGQFDLQETITAIASVGRYACIVASWQGDRGNLQIIDLGNNLDAIIEEQKNLY